MQNSLSLLLPLLPILDCVIYGISGREFGETTRWIVQVLFGKDDGAEKAV
jgi:hypothetical protein